VINNERAETNLKGWSQVALSSIRYELILISTRQITMEAFILNWFYFKNFTDVHAEQELQTVSYHVNSI
jgi:hypothetical protein